MQSEWSATESAADLVGAGRERGYEFTVQELTQALDAMNAVEHGELDESQLEMVAGGAHNFYEGWPAKWYVPPPRRPSTFPASSGRPPRPWRPASALAAVLSTHGHDCGPVG